MSAESVPPTGLLSGLRVIECATYVAGPLAGRTMAQLGADVIRIDDVRGSADRTRWPVSADGTSLLWAGLNQGVRSVALDLRSPRGQELTTALIAAPGPGRGLFVHNTIGREFLADDRLRAHRADLVHVHILGRPDGSPAVDYTVNPEYGAPVLSRREGSDDPVNHTVPTWDLSTGLLAVTALLSGLDARRRTGRGTHVQLALSDVAAAGMAGFGWYAEALAHGDRERTGNHVYGAFGVDFRCGDGRSVVAVAITAAQWRDLVMLTGRGEVVDALARAYDADFSCEGDRYRHRHVLRAVLADWFEARSSAEAVAAAAGTRALISAYRTPAEVAVAALAGRETPVLTEVDQPGIGPMLTAGSPLRIDGDYRPPLAAPAFGADTEWALAELGLSTGEIATLMDDGTAGPR